MDHLVDEVMNFVRENDVQFIRLSFCDLLGTQKNLAILPSELKMAFEHGISIDAHAIKGFTDVVNSDLFLLPDPATLTVLPWRPGPGRVVRFFCDIKRPDGSTYEHDSRSILKRVLQRGESLGYVYKVGTECEFYLFKADENGDPTFEPIDRGGYLDLAPLDKGENIRREICLILDEIGINPEISHHEQGPGQNEIDFKYSDPLRAADHFFLFKSVVKAVASRNGFFASFMPKPLAGAPGSGLHINLSMSHNGINIFQNEDDEHSAVVESFIAGILERITEITLFLNPITNSYERLGAFEAPKFISWSHQNRSQLIRIPAARGERLRMELRSPDPSLNPYLAFALILAAAIEGIEKKLILPPSVDADLFDHDAINSGQLECLPANLEQALQRTQDSEFVKSVLGESLIEKYLALKEEEFKAYTDSGDKEKFYREEYFTSI